jgi:uncharacterized protein YecE (DUF72 family)
MGEILVGITSWTEPTLIESGQFYPASARTAEARLKYYASQFPIVEVDSTYYAMPNERTSGLWAIRTPDEFVFDVKAFRLFTQHQTSPVALPKDIREALPAELKTRKNIYYRDVPDDAKKELWHRFAQALLPLDSTGKLGVVLFQFPPWFFPGDREREHIAYCQEMLPQYRLAIEFRYASWTNEKNVERTLSFLREHSLAYVCCDEPQGFKSSVPLLIEATCDIGVMRLHGRNKDTWEKTGISTAERFNYLYSEEELHELSHKMKELAAKTKQLHVLFNNCYGHKAVLNARETKLMLD